MGCEGEAREIRERPLHWQTALARDPPHWREWLQLRKLVLTSLRAGSEEDCEDEEDGLILNNAPVDLPGYADACDESEEVLHRRWQLISQEP